mgnify:CR=1 FL=1
MMWLPGGIGTLPYLTRGKSRAINDRKQKAEEKGKVEWQQAILARPEKEAPA